MSMTLSGNGTITGLVSGGLPDGTVLPADLSTGGPYWDTSGNLGIGTASPATRLHVVGEIRNSSDISNSGDPVLYSYNGGTAGTVRAGIQLIGSIPEIRFSIANSEKMRLDSSGNLLVGASANTGTNRRELVLQGENGSLINLGANGYPNSFQLICDTGPNALIMNKSNTPMIFYTNNTERMRIGNTGNVTVKGANFALDAEGTSDHAYAWVYADNASGKNAYLYLVCPGSNSGALMYERSTSRLYAYSQGGGVYLGPTATSWSSTSDERVKDIIEPIENAAEKVSSLRAVIGKYKTDKEGVRRSFLIAQDVQAVLPEAVSAENPEELGLSYTDVIPLLVAAIKELSAQNKELTAALQELIKEAADLKAEVASLKGEQ